jgi:hypothetical protein
MILLKGLKLFPHKNVDIIKQNADDTEYIFSNTKYAEELIKNIV